jgi:lysyl oxidase
MTSRVWVHIFLLLGAVADVARALPDLVPEVDDVRVATGQSVSSGDVAEGCAGGTRNRTLVRFGVRFWNYGTDPLVIGTPGCPDCEENPGAVCEDPRFICSPADGHNHPHFDDFASYELLDPAGAVVARGFKASFCVRENGCANGEPSGDYSCEDRQGIGVECYDYYRSSLGCQYIDATDVPGATRRAFRIRVTLDPNAQLPDADRGNNAIEFAIAGCGDGHVDAGEDCDAGTATDQPCCDGECRFAAAGTTCRASRDACDPVEACSGRASTCPTDRVADDGASCGPGVPPCITDRCERGVCTQERTANSCFIDGTCLTDGASDDSGCRTCSPSVRRDDWTEVSTPDVLGLHCQLGRIAAAADGCTAKTVRQMRRRLARLDVLLRRVSVGAHTADRARFARRTRKLARFATQRGCASPEVSALALQTAAFVAAADMP